MTEPGFCISGKPSDHQGVCLCERGQTAIKLHHSLPIEKLILFFVQPLYVTELVFAKEILSFDTRP